MNSFWLSDNLTTQNWMATRAEFLFGSLTSRVPGYYQGQLNSQSQFGEILYGLAQEIAKLDAYSNFMFDQSNMATVDAKWLYCSEGPLFHLPTTIPKPDWFDTFVIQFINQLDQLFTQPSTPATMQSLAQALFQVPYTTTPTVQLNELFVKNDIDNIYTIVDQHIVDIRVPSTQPLDYSLTGLLSIVDEIRPAHVLVRFVATPMATGDYIHGATLQDPYYFKLYEIEKRPAVVLLSWAQLGITSTTTPTWFNPIWFDLAQGIFSSSLIQAETSAEAQSGVFGPGIQPTSRYIEASYSFQ